MKRIIQGRSPDQIPASYLCDICHAMLTSIQSAGVSPEVNLRNSTQTRKRTSEKFTLALKPRADVTRSPKQGYQWPHKKDSYPTKLKK